SGAAISRIFREFLGSADAPRRTFWLPKLGCAGLQQPTITSISAAATASAMLSSQERIGPYRLMTLVGTGRNCQAWDALDDERSERRALKVLLPSQSGNREQVGLLKHEFMVGRSLDHPNVIHIYDYRTHRETCFLVMELFAAQNLK